MLSRAAIVEPLTTTPVSSAVGLWGSDDLRFLDGLRGLAALYVMIGHARWLLWEGYSEGYLQHPDSYSQAGKALVYFFSIFRYGREAVLFFFVLSGFVIHLRYARKLKAEGHDAEFDWLPFIRRRARRLYPPLFAAVALTFLLDSWGRFLGFAIYNQSTPYALINVSVVPHLGLVTLAGNLAYLMETYVPVYGSNGPLWSLKFEWWFYMAYPLFWWLTRRSLALATILMVGLFVVSFQPTLWPIALLRDVFSAMLIWWLGVLLAESFVGRIQWRMPAMMVGCFCLAILLVMLVGKPLNDLAVGLGFTGLLALCFELSRRNVLLIWLARLKPLGDMSYTLYVVHFPLLVFMSGWLMSRSQRHELPTDFSWVVIGILGTMMIAFGLHFFLERPFSARAKAQSKIAAYDG